MTQQFDERLVRNGLVRASFFDAPGMRLRDVVALTYGLESVLVVYTARDIPNYQLGISTFDSYRQAELMVDDFVRVRRLSMNSPYDVLFQIAPEAGMVTAGISSLFLLHNRIQAARVKWAKTNRDVAFNKMQQAVYEQVRRDFELERKVSEPAPFQQSIFDATQVESPTVRTRLNAAVQAVAALEEIRPVGDGDQI